MAFGQQTSSSLRRRRRDEFRPGSALPTPQGLTTPANSAPGGSAPGAPAPSYSAPDIRDASYNDDINLAWRGLGDFTAYTAGSQANLRAQYGYSDDAGTVDPNNPLGRAQLLKRTYDQTTAGTSNSYAARGQQTSGAYGRAQGNNLFNYQASSDQLQKSFLQQNADLLQRLREAQGTYGLSAIQAGRDALGRAIDRRDVGVQPQAQARALGANERIATSKEDGKQWVYRLKNGQWQRVRRA